jgi:hypothetical protein
MYIPLTLQCSLRSAEAFLFAEITKRAECRIMLEKFRIVKRLNMFFCFSQSQTDFGFEFSKKSRFCVF